MVRQYAALLKLEYNHEPWYASRSCCKEYNYMSIWASLQLLNFPKVREFTSFRFLWCKEWKRKQPSPPNRTRKHVALAYCGSCVVVCRALEESGAYSRPTSTHTGPTHSRVNCMNFSSIVHVSSEFHSLTRPHSPFAFLYSVSISYYFQWVFWYIFSRYFIADPLICKAFWHIQPLAIIIPF